MGKKIQAMFFNGSPRKNKNRASSESHQACLNGRVVREEGVANTADMLQSAMRGAEAAGAETELVHLYDIDLKNAYELGKRLVCKAVS
ncbi:MAG: hypothetical protein IJ710_00135 [Prevotella sp.]|nr:hypothetical protein [Prevotella sp.]